MYLVIQYVLLLAHFPFQRLTTLFVSASHTEHVSLANLFSRSNLNLQPAFTCEEALASLGREQIAVVICDGDHSDWRLLIASTEALQSPPRVIVASRKINENLWSEVVAAGGYDFLTIPWDQREVLNVVALAWQSWEYGCRVSFQTPFPVACAGVSA